MRHKAKKVQFIVMSCNLEEGLPGCLTDLVIHAKIFTNLFLDHDSEDQHMVDA